MMQASYLRLLLALCLTAPCTWARGQENDLSPLEAVSIDAVVYSAYEQASGRMAVYLEVPHSYTNSLSCSGRLPYWVDEGRGERRAKRSLQLEGLCVFPERAFARLLSYPLATPLEPAERVAAFGEETVPLLCRGWNAETPLPSSLCENPGVNPAHGRACASLAPGASYPFMIHNQYLGACRCRG